MNFQEANVKGKTKGFPLRVIKIFPPISLIMYERKLLIQKIGGSQFFPAFPPRSTPGLALPPARHCPVPWCAAVKMEVPLAAATPVCLPICALTGSTKCELFPFYLFNILRNPHLSLFHFTSHFPQSSFLSLQPALHFILFSHCTILIQNNITVIRKHLFSSQQWRDAISSPLIQTVHLQSGSINTQLCDKQQ